MYTVSTKHKSIDRSGAPSINTDGGVREVDFPKRVPKVDLSEKPVSLGYHEPANGRYSTLVRENYRGSREGQPNMPPAATAEHRRVVQDMRGKHFHLGEEPMPAFSESHSQLVHPSPKLLREIAGTKQQIGKIVAGRNMDHVFVSSTDLGMWYGDYNNSTQRTSYGVAERGATASLPPATPQHASSPVSAARSSRLSPSRLTTTQKDAMNVTLGSTAASRSSAMGATGGASERNNARSLQGGTHFTLGTDATPWASTTRSDHSGRANPDGKVGLIRNAGACLSLGSSDVDLKDTLRSLKQVDYVAHRQGLPSHQTQTNMQRNSLVLGYNTKDNRSSSRVAYAPVRFKRPE